MVDLLKSLLGWLWELLSGMRKVRVRVHKAYFTYTEPRVYAYFVNVVNLSESREIEITHVWFEHEGRQFPADPVERPLPKRLKPDESWETWMEFERLPRSIHDSAYGRARVRLSSGRIVKSRRADNVPKSGTVPGGELTSYPSSGDPSNRTGWEDKGADTQ